MKKVISLITCFVIAVFAQDEQKLPQEQAQQQPSSQEQQQCQCQCPKQKEYKYKYQYQYPPQQEQYQQRQVTNMESRIRVQRLIEDGLKKNKYKIMMESSYLEPDDIDALYRENEQSAVGYALLSSSVGFGIGSYIQGNVAFGIAQSALDVVGTLFIANDVGGAGAVLLPISRVAGLIAAFYYRSSYNKTLKDALNGNGFSYSIDPLIIPKEGAPAVGLAFNLRY
ncbi:MAG: hypothetical protein LBC75_00605 [Fibromonadaceae bacterium]|jgi:hypothetical protein|nr:hypothetical protein [Fibromonadaceae bacterium]